MLVIIHLLELSIPSRALFFDKKPESRGKHKKFLKSAIFLISCQEDSLFKLIFPIKWTTEFIEPHTSPK